MMVCLRCRSAGINNAQVVERPIEVMGQKTSKVGQVCIVCSTPVSCQTFGGHEEENSTWLPMTYSYNFWTRATLGALPR